MSIRAGSRVHDIALNKRGMAIRYIPPVRFGQRHGEWRVRRDDGVEIDQGEG